MPDEPIDHCAAADEGRPAHVEQTLDFGTPTPEPASNRATTNGAAANQGSPNPAPPFLTLDVYATRDQPADKNHSERFVILRPLNKGNLGVVSVALDKELYREIALKHIRDDRADSEPHRQSFVREAEITGKLEHPGIVPVYSFGTDADNRQFYAMRLIRGIDLRTALQLFHKTVKAKQVPYDSPELRELIQNLIGVCHTIAYAHSRGVLHRDLKPANIMLGPYGETLVVDWGLAKTTGVASGAVDQEHKSVHDFSSDEGPLETTQSATENTVNGSIIGTPVYAPPEQLTGNLPAIDHRSDIYSLGAILFEILTGSPPLTNMSLGELIATVKAGLVPAPREVLPQVPKAISAICRRAMQPVPNDRYQSVQEFRKDLEAWLYDLPVSAYHETTWERAHRWMRTHQTFVRASAISLVLIACVSTVAALFINHARNSEAVARREATDLYRLARSTTDTLLTTTSDRLAEIPDATDLRQELLRSAATAYEQMAENHSTDAGLKRETASSLLGLAGVQRKLDDGPAASESLKNSIAKLEGLVNSPQATDDDSLALTQCLIELSRVSSDMGNEAEALATVVRALEILDRFINASNASPNCWLLRGQALIQRAIIEQDRNDSLAAAGANQSAIAALRRGLERANEPELTLSLRFQLARALTNLSYNYSSQNPQDVKVQAALEESLQNLVWCMERQPHNSEIIKLQALVQNNLADYLRDRGDLEAARKSYEPSLEFFSNLVREQPLVPEYKNGLTLVHLGLGNVAHYMGQKSERTRQYELANEMADQLIKQNSVRSTFRTTCVHAKFAFAESLTDEEPEKALVLLAELDKLLSDDREVTLFDIPINRETILMQAELAKLSILRRELAVDVPAGLGERLNQFVEQSEKLESWQAIINSACYISLACAKLAELDPQADALTSAKESVIKRLKQMLTNDPERWKDIAEQPELDFLRQKYASEFEALKP